MIRILLPLAVIAALIFGPLATGETVTVGGITKPSTVTGIDYLDGTIKCWRAGNYSISGECAAKGGTNGTLVLATVIASGIAAAIGVIGILPFIGRLTSVVTTLAGAISTLAMGYFAMNLMNAGGQGNEALGWGAYLAVGGGLLTLISGLSGMRGR